jgi:hypothetical protein
MNVVTGGPDAEPDGSNSQLLNYIPSKISSNTVLRSLRCKSNFEHGLDMGY